MQNYRHAQQNCAEDYLTTRDTYHTAGLLLKPSLISYWPMSAWLDRIEFSKWEQNLYYKENLQSLTNNTSTCLSPHGKGCFTVLEALLLRNDLLIHSQCIDSELQKGCWTLDGTLHSFFNSNISDNGEMLSIRWPTNMFQLCSLSKDKRESNMIVKTWTHA